MPIYEFQCSSCGTRSEHLMRLSDPDPSECPGCDKPQLHRLLSAPQFRLAGGGWYETDFKGDKDKKRNLAGGGGSGGDSALSNSGGAESKPAESKPATATNTASAPASSTSGASSSSSGSASSPASTTPKTGTSGS